MNNIKRNPYRFRKPARRTAQNWIDVMTPQGQALYCAEHVENASGRHLLYHNKNLRTLQKYLEN